jgi:hypothetical protein
LISKNDRDIEEEREEKYEKKIRGYLSPLLTKQRTSDRTI